MANYLGQDFKAYLDQTGLGNSLAALNVLAANFRGDLSLTPTQAKAKITELRKADNAMERHVLDRCKILARVANPKSKAERYSAYSPSGNPNSTIGEWKVGGPAKSLEAQLAEIENNKDLYSQDGPKRKPLVEQRAKIKAAIAALGGK